MDALRFGSRTNCQDGNGQHIRMARLFRWRKGSFQKSETKGMKCSAPKPAARQLP
jgi:hypothetical protein